MTWSRRSRGGIDGGREEKRREEKRKEKKRREAPPPCGPGRGRKRDSNNQLRLELVTVKSKVLRGHPERRVVRSQSFALLVEAQLLLHVHISHILTN